MKLNNKGFAFSTMLYGVLSLIIIVLMLVFGVMKAAKNENSYYAEVLENTLNKCVSEEVALENCYSAGGNCDPTAYYVCMGINGEKDDEGGLIIAEKLKENVVTTGDGLYQDGDSNRYIYRGIKVNNYINYSGLTWRIVSIEADGSVKAIYPGYSEMLAWDSNNKESWEGSSLNNYLNNEFYSSLADTSGLSKKIWHTGRIFNTGVMPINELIIQENKSEYTGSSDTNGLIGLLSASDYIKASLNDTCSNDVLSSTTCNSWISVYKSWLINSNGDIPEQEPQQAYYFSNDNKLSTLTVETTYDVLPTIFLKRTFTINGGDGTVSNPYTVH
ncbi:MAG: hypothetical protein J6A52_00290 [Bacilli bacterium]|nr:hypothetical protein [Bacilli bacterium]